MIDIYCWFCLIFVKDVEMIHHQGQKYCNKCNFELKESENKLLTVSKDKI